MSSLLVREYDPILNRFASRFGGAALIERPKPPQEFPLECDCGKRSVVPRAVINNPKLETIRCPWCSAHWDVRRYTSLITGERTAHLAKRKPDEIILPEGYVRGAE